MALNQNLINFTICNLPNYDPNRSIVHFDISEVDSKGIFRCQIDFGSEPWLRHFSSSLHCASGIFDQHFDRSQMNHYY